MLSYNLRRLAIALVGETKNPPGLLLANVDAIAEKYDGLDAQLSPMLLGVSLEDLYVRRELAYIALGACRDAVQQEVPNNLIEYYQQEAATLLKMIATLSADIERVTLQARESGGVAVGLLTTTVPDPVPAGVYDVSNSARVRGQPRVRDGLPPW